METSTSTTTDIIELQVQIKDLALALAKRTKERDQARRDEAAAVQAAMEARATLWAAARALGLKDNEVEALPAVCDRALKETKRLREQARAVVSAYQNWREGLLSAEDEMILQIEQLEEAL